MNVRAALIITGSVLLYCILFAGVWMLAMKLIASRGWRLLAEKFPARARPEGRVLRFQSLNIGRVNYNNVLTFIISPAGLYLSSWGPFRYGHAPILIPWKEVQKASVEKFWFMKRLRLEIGSPAVTTLRLRAKLLDPAREYLQPKLAITTA
jgi:hypothetical protein